jgi:hypothetical protein
LLETSVWLQEVSLAPGYVEEARCWLEAREEVPVSLAELADLKTGGAPECYLCFEDLPARSLCFAEAVGRREEAHGVPQH